MTAPIAVWTAEPLAADVRTALERLASAEDVQHIAVMPDVHLAHGVCIGTVAATTRRIYPAAVGGDIGCGVTCLRLAANASALADPELAAWMLAGLYSHIPFIKQRSAAAAQLPVTEPLSATPLDKLAQRDGRLQFGTLGRGNHFLEFDRDDEGGLWLMVHSGSRAMGPAIRDFHLQRARGSHPLCTLDAQSPEGAAYLHDVAWARRYAHLNRRCMVDRCVELVHEVLGTEPEWDSLIDCDHNHVQLETHAGRTLWVHRKGALHAAAEQPGVIPGSMGSASYLVLGRGEGSSLCSSSHGAGRSLSRTDAKRRIDPRALLHDMHGVWFDHRLTDRLCEEGPGAYKDIAAVMRAQRSLTCIVRRLQPILVYKGGG